MMLDSFSAIVRTLEKAGVRFIVVGGLAVNAHGHLRFTRDADLVIELVPESIKGAFRALESIGYKPRLPISAEQFSNPDMREKWIREKNMQVLQFWSDQHKETPLDLFVKAPFDFEEEFLAAPIKPLGTDLEVKYARIETLIEMKRAAGRPQDLQDIEALQIILEENERSKQ